jgi:tetratricopeptide (TPR) repeat protein
MALLAFLLLSLPDAIRAQHVVNKFAYDALIGSQEAIEAGQIAEARAILETLREKEARLNDHEKALLYQSYGYLEAAEERYPEAIAHLETCLAQNALPEAGQLQTLYNLSQLYLATERFPEAVKSLSRWLRDTKDRPPDALYMLAAAYYQHGERKKALTPAILAVREAEKPKEAWLQLLLSLYVERQEYEKARPVLEKLTQLYPKKVYWMQLAAVYGELGQENESLAALELAYTQGLLDKDDELRRLARLYIYHELPYLGARVMEKGLAGGIVEPNSEAYEILANAWMRAREFDRAIDPLSRAASAAEDGKLYLRLGQAYAEKEDWGAAAAALKQAIAKGGLDDPGTASLLLGVALFNQDQLASARPHFVRAAQHEKTGKDARKWIKLIDKAQRGGAGADVDEAGGGATVGS